MSQCQRGILASFECKLVGKTFKLNDDPIIQMKGAAVARES